MVFVSSAVSRGVLDAGVWPLYWCGFGRSVGVGSGSDLSEEPVFQGVSRPRRSQSRPWVSSRARQSFS